MSGAGWCVALGCECEGRVVSVFGDPSDSEMSLVGGELSNARPGRFYSMRNHCRDVS